MAKKRKRKTLKPRVRPHVFRQFCVINPTSSKVEQDIVRSMFETEEGAVEHAQQLLNLNMASGKFSKCLFVVEVKQVVKIKTTFISTNPDPTSDDEEEF